MKCSAIHPEQQLPCRAEGVHPSHLAGYGKATLTWPNEQWTPPPARVSKAKLAEMALTLREARA